MNLSISDIIFPPFRTSCSHHSIFSSPLLPASEHPAWPALWMFFQSQHACTSGSSYKPMRAFRGTARPSSPLRSALRRIVGKPWTVSAKYCRGLWAVGFLFPFLFLSCERSVSPAQGFYRVRVQTVVRISFLAVPKLRLLDNFQQLGCSVARQKFRTHADRDNVGPRPFGRYRGASREPTAQEFPGSRCQPHPG